MANVRPLITTYRGTRFRSRLEAQWAVFFDHLGIAWDYEPQGYLVDGKAYLPDFALTGIYGERRVLAEVKPSDFPDTREAGAVCRTLAGLVDGGVADLTVLLIGKPHYRAMPYYDGQTVDGKPPTSVYDLLFGFLTHDIGSTEQPFIGENQLRWWSCADLDDEAPAVRGAAMAAANHRFGRVA
jgi:hypothetical protein